MTRDRLAKGEEQIVNNKVKLFSSLALACALGLGLASCANPIEALVNKGVESVVGGALGSDVSIDMGGGANLPSDWPNVPTPSSAPTFSLKTEQGFTAAFMVNQAEIDSIIGQFNSQGYTEDSVMEVTDGKIMNLKNDVYNVTLMVAADADNIMLSYLVYDHTQDQ